MKGLKIQRKKAKPLPTPSQTVLAPITLEGEATRSVPVYDSCDEVRKKIRAHLREPSITQASFLREIAKTFDDGRKIQSKVLNDFLNKKGAFAGNTSATFYASYVFFEKMRLREGKPKSKHRMEMERIHEGGFETAKRRDRITCMVGDVPIVDQYGSVSFANRP